LVISKQNLTFKNPISMKKVFLIMALGGLAFATANAQTTPTTATPSTTSTTAAKPAPAGMHPQMQAPMTADQVPDVVKNKFATDYPAVKDARWRKMGNNYGVYYRDGNNSGNVMYTSSGTLLRSMRQIDASALPAAATDYLAKNGGGQPVKTATEIKDGRGTTRYQVMANGKGLAFDEKGNLITPQTAQTVKPAPTQAKPNATTPK
jgi:hypothetical protein